MLGKGIIWSETGVMRFLATLVYLKHCIYLHCVFTSDNLEIDIWGWFALRSLLGHLLGVTSFPPFSNETKHSYDFVCVYFSAVMELLNHVTDCMWKCHYFALTHLKFSIILSMSHIVNEDSLCIFSSKYQ